MSLWVGNISKNVRSADLEDLFAKYGKCSMRQTRSFAFVDYEDDKSAEDAFKHLDGKDLGGLPISVEWSKKSKNYDERLSKKRPHARESRSD